MSTFFGAIRYLGSRLIYPISWTLLIIVLLCLPGKAIPSHGIFGIKNLDKVVHVGLFGTFVLLWGILSWNRIRSRQTWYIWLILVVVASVGLGVALEFVQAAYIPNRSFDVWDIWSDLAGSLLVMYLLPRYGRKYKVLIEKS